MSRARGVSRMRGVSRAQVVTSLTTQMPGNPSRNLVIRQIYVNKKKKKSQTILFTKYLC